MREELSLIRGHPMASVLWLETGAATLHCGSRATGDPQPAGLPSPGINQGWPRVEGTL